jgi:hypothetical protein
VPKSEEIAPDVSEGLAGGMANPVWSTATLLAMAELVAVAVEAPETAASLVDVTS